jgi:hypothetical protein
MTPDLETEFQRFAERCIPTADYKPFIQQGPTEEFIMLLLTYHTDRDVGSDAQVMSLKLALNDTTLAQISSDINQGCESGQTANQRYRDPMLKAYHLVIRTLFYWSTTPEEKAFPARQLRPIRFGPHFRSGLYSPRWVGEKTVFKNRPKPVKKRPDGSPRRHYVAHWVCGHQKRQAYGPGFSLRKLIYIMPYKTE